MQKDYKISEDVIIDVFNKKSIIIDKNQKKVIFWFGYNMRGIIPFEELGGDVRLVANEILSLFQFQFKATIISKEKDQSDEAIMIYYLSRKTYKTKIIDSIKIGEIYNGRISAVTAWGIFLKVKDGITVFIHCTEVSRSIIQDVRECFKIGDPIRVKIIDKKLKNGEYKLYGSRKQASIIIKPSVGEFLPVMITGEINRTAYFCEVTPGQKGIIHPKKNERFLIGEKVYAYVTEFEKNGFCLRRY